MNKIVLSKSEEILIDAIINKIKPFNKIVEAELRIKENELKMSAPDFQRIRKFLERNEFQQQGTASKMLDITLHSSDRLDQREELSNLRFTLKDRDIALFCQTSNFSVSSADIIFKNSLFWNEEEKKKLNIPDNESRIVHDFDYPLRLGLKYEIPYNHTKSSFDVPKSSHSSNLQINSVIEKANSTFKSLKDKYGSNLNFNKMYKSFRLKQRVTYTSKLQPNIRIDLTVIKSSKKPTLDFIDSGTMESSKSYECEFEIVNNDKFSLKEFKDLMSQVVSPVLCELQQHPIIMPSSHREICRWSFQKFYKELMISRISHKLAVCQEVQNFEKRKKLEEEITRVIETQYVDPFTRDLLKNMDRVNIDLEREIGQYKY